MSHAECKRTNKKRKLENDFDNWMSEINRILLEKIQLDVTDLPDEDFFNHYIDGYSAEEIVDQMIKNYLEFFDLMTNEE